MSSLYHIANKTIGNAIAGASSTMGTINRFDTMVALMRREMDSKGVMKSAAEFQKEQMKVYLFNIDKDKSDLVTQMIDESFDADSGIEEEADEEVNKILMQVAGVRLEGMSLVPAGGVASPEQGSEDLDLNKLLAGIY